MKIDRSFVIIGVVLLVTLVLGQGLSYLLAPDSWQVFITRLPVILSMIAFWGPVIALVAALVVWAMMHLLGFTSIAMIREESVEQNNPAPAIVFVGTLIASLLFLMLVIRP